MSARVRIGAGDERVELELLERLADDLPGAGDVRVRASLRVGGRRGEYDQVWLERPALDAFVERLTTAVASGDGSAVLEAMSPGELRLALTAGDPARVEVVLAPVRFDGERHVTERVAGGFPLPPNELPALARAFAELCDARTEADA